MFVHEPLEGSQGYLNSKTEMYLTLTSLICFLFNVIYFDDILLLYQDLTTQNSHGMQTEMERLNIRYYYNMLFYIAYSKALQSL